MPPPPIHTGGKSGSTAAGASGASLPAAADLVQGSVFSPSINSAVASNDCGSPHDKTFVENIHTLLEVPSYSSIISWNDAGTAVIIHDVDAFISTIMPVHFKHSQFGSFTRRMRRWGFRVTKKRSSPSSPSKSSERGQSNAMEFSSEHFLRDQPEMCLLMKDERQTKKKFQFLDRNVRKSDGVVENNQGSAVGVVHYPPSSSSRGSIVKPPFESNQPIPVHYPQSLPNMNTAMSEPRRLSTGNMGLSAAMNDGYLQNYSQETTSMMPPLISPSQHSIQSAVPMMNTMMPPNLPQLQYQYPPYGNTAPPGGSGYSQASPAFQYPSAPYVYPPPQPQQQLHTQTQQQQQQLNQQYPPLPPTAASFFRNVDARASTETATANVVLMSSLSQSSSDEAPTEELDLLPTKKSPARAHSQLDTEQNVHKSQGQRR